MKLVRFNQQPSLINWVDNLFDKDLENIFNRNTSCVPSANILESKENFEIDLVVPGFSKEDLKINVENEDLTISSEKQAENVSEEKNYTRKEFEFCSFSRSFHLPKTVDAEKISADFRDGILKVIVPKKEEAKTKLLKEIKIN